MGQHVNRFEHCCRRAAARVSVVLILVSCFPAGAFVTEVTGPTPDLATGQSWWPPGVEALAKHPTRAYSRQSEAMEWIYFDAGMGEIKELLDHFSKAALRDHQVEVKVGPAAARTFDGNDIPYTVLLEIPDGPWNSHLNPEREWREPRLTVFLNDDHALNAKDLSGNLCVRSELPEFSAIVRTTPERTRLEGRATDKKRLDGAPNPTGMRAWVLLRDTKARTWVCIGVVRPDGMFTVWLSKDESDKLARGEAQLTMSSTLAPENEEEIELLALDIPEGLP